VNECKSFTLCSETVAASQSELYGGSTMLEQLQILQGTRLIIPNNVFKVMRGILMSELHFSKREREREKNVVQNEIKKNRVKDKRKRPH